MSSVVARERDLGRARVALDEGRQVVRRRAGERVDRLVLVADDAQVVAIAEPELEQLLLERVRVLVLVDAEPALARPDHLGRLGVGLEQLDGLGQEIVEVELVRPRLLPLVVAEDANEQVDRDRRLALRPLGLELVRPRRDPARLRPADLVREVLRRRELVVPRQLPGEPADEPARARRGSRASARRRGAPARSAAAGSGRGRGTCAP